MCFTGLVVGVSGKFGASFLIVFFPKHTATFLVRQFKLVLALGRDQCTDGHGLVGIIINCSFHHVNVCRPSIQNKKYIDRKLAGYG